MLNERIRFWLGDEGCEITPITVGNINQTFLVQAGSRRLVLQKLNPIFAPEVNLDIHDLTEHLAHKGLSTPKLVPTRDGDFWKIIDNECWRLLTFVEGENFNAIQNIKLAQKAGHLVGEFHAALADFKHNYHFARLNVHDTKGHVEKLKKAIDLHPIHPLGHEVRLLAEKIFLGMQSLPDLSALPKRHCHGDLKINNLVFGPHTNSLIDLDTIGLMPWPIEMADAFRSWCNPAGEDTAISDFDENLFEVSLLAYTRSASRLWTKEESDALIAAMLTIPLELSSRFLRDVLEDSYFGFDASRFESRAAHNLVRAKSQLSVYCEIDRKRSKLEGIVHKAFA